MFSKNVSDRNNKKSAAPDFPAFPTVEWQEPENLPETKQEKDQMFWTDWYFKEKERYKDGAPPQLPRHHDEEDPPAPTKESSSRKRSDLAYRQELTNIVCSVQKAKNRISEMRVNNDEVLRQTFTERFTPRPENRNFDTMNSSRSSSFHGGNSSMNVSQVSFRSANLNLSDDKFARPNHNSSPTTMPKIEESDELPDLGPLPPLQNSLPPAPAQNSLPPPVPPPPIPQNAKKAKSYRSSRSPPKSAGNSEDRVRRFS